MQTIKQQIVELRKQAQQKMAQLEAAIANNDNNRAMELTGEISNLHTRIAKLALADLKGSE